MSSAPDFHSVYSQYSLALHQYALRLTKNHHDALDIVQETFFRYVQNSGDIAIDRVKGWLYRTCYHVFIDVYRKQKRIQWTPIEMVSDIADQHSFDKFPEEVVLHNELLNDLLHSLRPLGERDQRAFLLFVLDDLSYKQIAQHLGCTDLIVKSILHRVRTKIKGRLLSRIQLA